jgi:5-methylcytosine-specific restriction enzyme A
MSRKVKEWVGEHDDAKVPPRVRLRILRAYNNRCYLSGREIRPGDAWELEHKVALILGGEHRESNLAPALPEFHKAKTAAEMAVKAKTDALAKKHLRIVDADGPKIKSAGFALTRKQAEKRAKRESRASFKQPLPRPELGRRYVREE